MKIKNGKLAELMAMLSSDKAIARRVKYLTVTNDLEMVILKGHLLIEEQLLLLILENVKHPIAITESKRILSFYNLLTFANTKLRSR